MALNPDDIASLQMCESCYSETAVSCKLACRHVICTRCDSDYRQSYPDSECLKCENHPDISDDDGDYLTPFNPLDVRRLTAYGHGGSTSQFCESCHRAEIILTVRCYDCDMDICETCEQQHSLMSFLKSHRLYPRVDATDTPPRTPNVRCRKHSDIVADMTCISCDRKHLCRQCIEESHSEHEVEVEGSSKSNNGSPPMSPITLSAPQPTKTFTGLLGELDSFTKDMNGKKERLFAEIATARMKIQRHALDQVTGLLAESEQMKNDIDAVVVKQTKAIQMKQKELLTRLIKRKNFIDQRTEKMGLEIEKIHSGMETYLHSLNRQSASTGNYIKMVPESSTNAKRESFQEALDQLQSRREELMFKYIPPTKPTDGLGMIEPLRRFHVVSRTHVDRFKREAEYIVTGITAAPGGNNVLISSCKGERKAAVDFVNIHGNVLRTRKLHDPHDDIGIMTPAFGALVTEGTAIMAWDNSVFRMDTKSQAEVESFGVRKNMVPGAKISCLAISVEHEQIALGNDKNGIINLFNFDFNVDDVVTVTLKEEVGPPKSLAFFNKNFLVADEVNSAFLSDSKGNTMVRFPSPRADSTPLAIDSKDGIAYVLWREHGPTALVQFYSLQRRNLGEMIGRYLSVHGCPRFIAIVPMAGQEDNRLLTIAKDGEMIIYGIQDI